MMVDGARHGANKKMGQFAHFLFLCAVAIYCRADFIQ